MSDVSYFVSGTDSSLDTYNYTYDKAGNLEKITTAGQTVVRYYYDGLNRLRREDNYTVRKTTVLDYDEGGNIIFKKEYALTTDLNLGNPTRVKCRDDEGNMSFWKKLAIAVAVVVAVVVVTAAVAAATAATGAVVGGVQGAVEGYQETGTVEGTLRGMGKGAVKGAVQGAADGMISGMVSGAFAGAAMSMSGNPMFCFVAGTTVLTTLGKKAIETILRSAIQLLALIILPVNRLKSVLSIGCKRIWHMNK